MLVLAITHQASAAEQNSNTTTPALPKTKEGCQCVTECDTSIDASTPWCYTSPEGLDPSLVKNPCGSYSSLRNGYWDTCVNVTSSALLTDFKGMRVRR